MVSTGGWGLNFKKTANISCIPSEFGEWEWIESTLPIRDFVFVTVAGNKDFELVSQLVSLGLLVFIECSFYIGNKDSIELFIFRFLRMNKNLMKNTSLLWMNWKISGSIYEWRNDKEWRILYYWLLVDLTIIGFWDDREWILLCWCTEEQLLGWMSMKLELFEEDESTFVAIRRFHLGLLISCLDSHLSHLMYSFW